MNMFGLFSRKKQTASAARDRLQILLAHERTGGGSSDLLAKLREEVMAVVARHVEVDESRLTVSMKKEEEVSILEIDLEIPDTQLPRLKLAASR